MVEILDWLVNNFEFALIFLGIVLIVVAIIRGGFSIGKSTLGELTNKQALTLGAFGLLLVATGVAIWIFSNPDDNESLEEEPTVIVELPPVIETTSIGGKLIDIFGNKLNGERIRLYYIQDTLIKFTNEIGEFLFKDLPIEQNYVLEYKNETDSISVFEDKIYDFTLIHNPLWKAQVLLCSGVDQNRNPIIEFDKEHAIIDRKDLPVVENEDYEYRITCYIRMYGVYAKARQTNNILEFEWKNGNHSEVQKVETKYSESGWRTWNSKRIWKGRWTLEIRTLTGEVIEHFIFEII